MTDEVAAELLAAAKEVMLGGSHKGRCTNEAPWDDGACERHVRKSKRRHKRLAAAIARAEAEDPILIVPGLTPSGGLPLSKI